MMMRAKIHYILSIVSILLVLTSCFKKETYPLEPIITYDSYNLDNSGNQPKLKLIINFTDGNGDIGLADSDTIAPFNVESEFHYNLLVNYFEKDDAQGWVAGKDLEDNDIVFKYRIKPILTTGKQKGIKGKIEIDMNELFFNPISNQSDTIKYTVQLIDKALNKSNVVESKTVIR